MSIKFTPVQCTSEVFDTMSYHEGCVYFVTDTKKIYLGKDGNAIPMAVSSGIFYGKKDILWDDDGNVKPTEEKFLKSEIEDLGEGMPERDDLILNMDGCFYRVTDVNDDEFTTSRVTLRGSGGGGGSVGGGTGSDTPSGGSFGISVNKNPIFASADTEMKFPFTINYSGTDGNYIMKIEFKLYDSTASDESKKEIEFYTMERDQDGKTLQFNTAYNAYFYQFKNRFKATQYLKMYVYDMYENVKSATIKVSIKTLQLIASAEDLLVTTNNVLPYTCKISGDTASNEITYSFYAEDNEIEPACPPQTATVGPGNYSTNLKVDSLPHGVYILKVQATAAVSGSAKRLESNILTHKVGVFKANSTEPLLMVKLPNKLEQYTNLPMKYQVLTAESNEEYTLDIQVNKVSKVQQTVLSNQSGEYDLYFETAGTYTLDVTVIELNLSYSIPITITKYSGEIPVIDSNYEHLKLYLNPRDQSNDAIDRDVWADYRGAAINNLEELTGTLTNLHYGEADGWMKDSQGVPYLQLASGASLTLNKFEPFKTDLSRNNPGLTIELDFEVNGVTDFDESLIECVSKDSGSINVGFIITGNRITFNGSTSDGVALTLVEGKRTRVSFVVEPYALTTLEDGTKKNLSMMYGYLNGIISSAKLYEEATFIQSQHHKAFLKAKSDKAVVKIYGIRFYGEALDDRTILNNYTASLPTLEEREASYLSNNKVYDAYGNISYDEVSNPDYNLEIPYMVLTGGYATETDAKWTLKDSSNRGDPQLPTGKKDYRLVDVKVVYPKSDTQHQNFEFINEFAGGKPMKDVYGESPTNGGAIMYCQGTSSMEYPIKNLRLRFKNSKNWYKVEPNLDSVEIICMKADYMESSGSHNTGSGNMIDDLYNSMGLRTPGQEHFQEVDSSNKVTKRIVTAIKGYPCLIFYSPTGEAGTYEYIGKYNLNLDKATPEPFGFNHDIADPKFGHLTNELGQLLDVDGQVVDEEGEVTVDKKTGEMSVGGKKLVNSIFCFEFLDNAIEVCNFLNKAKAYNEDGSADASAGYYTYDETWYNEFVKGSDLVPGWALGFESRYPEDKLGAHDADALQPLAKWLNTLHAKSNQEEAIEEFKNNYWKYLDKDFLLVYYLYTEALLMADSRVKNMMIATWGKEHRYFNPTSGEVRKTAPENMSGWQEHFGYIFYPIFYDMDTMLGLDNTGKYRFNYYDEDYSDVYNGANILWNYVRDSFDNRTTKKSYYDKMESSALQVDKTGKTGILNYFNTHQADKANEAFYNGDAKYKYVNPAVEGYQDLLYDKYIKPGEAPYLYAAQGDRSALREWFITNRLSFLSGKYASTKFQNGDRIVYRQYYPNVDSPPDNFAGHEATLTAVPPSGVFNFTSLQTGYAGVLLGANGELTSTRFNGEDTQSIEVTNMSQANGTEAYIVGLSNLTSLGDMSDKYMQKLVIESDNVRLEKLILGNTHKDYYNPYWGTTVTSGSVNDSPKIGLTSATHLKEFNFYNCSTYGSSLDFSNCKVIEKILLTGSGVTSVMFPTGGIMKEVRLPASVRSITIDSCNSLTPSKFSIGGYDYTGVDRIQPDNDERYLNEYKDISVLAIVDTNIDTYSMACGADMLNDYCLRGINWTITNTNSQYCLRNASDNLTSAQIKKCYIYDGNQKKYVLWGQEEFPDASTIGSLYEKVDMVNANNEMVCIPILEKLQRLTPTYTAKKHSEALTGTITINVSGIKANELAIYERYINIYPNVNIVFAEGMSGVTRAHRVKFYRTMYTEGIDVTHMEPYYMRLTDGTKTLAELINSNEFSDPVKSSSATEVFIFTKEWVDTSDQNKTVYKQNNFASIKPTSDMTLVPKFTISERKYTVHFFDYDNTALPNLTINNATYLGAVKSFLNSSQLPHAQYRYRSDNGLASDERWTFKGWMSEVDYNAMLTNSALTPTILDLNTTLVSSNMKLYAYYAKENATQVASDMILFNISPKYTLHNVSKNGYSISIKPEFVSLIQGKITVPSKDSSGNNIEALGSFVGCINLKEIYFLPNNAYTKIADTSCEGNTNLEKVYWPNNITDIGTSAFHNCYALTINESHRLPNALTIIGSTAFWGCDNIYINNNTLPQSVTHLNTQCFMGCDNVSLNVFGGTNNIQYIGHGAFHNAASKTSVTEVIIHSPVTLGESGSTGNYKTFESAYNPNIMTTFKSYSNFGKTNVAELAEHLFGRTITNTSNDV